MHEACLNQRKDCLRPSCNRGAENANSQHYGWHALPIRCHRGSGCHHDCWHCGTCCDFEGSAPAELRGWRRAAEEGKAAQRDAHGQGDASSDQLGGAGHVQAWMPSLGGLLQCNQLNALSPARSTKSRRLTRPLWFLCDSLARKSLLLILQDKLWHLLCAQVPVPLRKKRVLCCGPAPSRNSLPLTFFNQAPRSRSR